MMRGGFCKVTVAACAAVSISAFQSSPVNRPWPPEVQRAALESPPLAPHQALQTFYMPPGYRVELVASEPLVQDPVAIDWDVAGRLWVVEMPGYMPDISAAGEHDPVGRIVVLQDLNGDGRMDHRTVFADGLVLARSIKILDRGVLVAEPPNVWLMHDTDGDLRMDAKQLVTDRYGGRHVDPQNNANGFLWALDNRMYTAGQADIHLRLKSGAFEIHETLPRGQWGVAQDDAGRIYRNTNESALHVDLVPTAYYARNPNLLRTRGSYERLATGNENLNVVWPVRPNPGTNRAYQTGIDRPDGTLAKFTAVCAPLVYRGDRLPAELRGNVFVAEPAANLVSRIVLDEDARGLRARKAYSRGEFLASTDERFRPVFLSDAPDGTLYVVDFYRGVIEHRMSLTEYLRDYSVGRKLERPIGLGRIYRIVHAAARRDASRVAVGNTSELIEALSHPNGWRRDAAQRLLVERGEGSAFPALVKLAASAPDWRTRLHALWTMDGIDVIEPALVLEALADPARDVRAAALRLAERWLSEPNHPIVAAVLARLDDPDWAVRHQLAASIGAMPAPVRETAAVAVLNRYGSDPVILDATLSGLRGGVTAVLETLLASGSEVAPKREGDGKIPLKRGGTATMAAPDRDASADVEAAIIMAAGTIVRSAQDAAIQNLVAWIADPRRPSWQRSALLRGAEVALLGVPMPGSPPGGRAAGAASEAPLPCPTCPGGRAGPGGAYAFPRPQTRGSQPPRSPGARLRLAREPAALARLAGETGELARRVEAVLARVSWPGKPGEVSVAPLSADEQQRFDAGQQIYRNLCQACHQADGRGQERLAPGLIDSALTLAPAGIVARILLNGKEGAMGLMPPVGAAIDDEQIASVLTYVRREWGQIGTPVEPQTIARVRAGTAGRTRPWTHDELLALIPAHDR